MNSTARSRFCHATPELHESIPLWALKVELVDPAAPAKVTEVSAFISAAATITLAERFILQAKRFGTATSAAARRFEVLA